MIYSIAGSKDISIYYGQSESSASLNTGLDEILEIRKVRTSTTGVQLSRSLLKFDLSGLSIYGTSGSRSFHLKVFSTEPRDIPLSFSLNINPVSQSWQMGSGRFYNDPPTTEGASWNFRTGKTEADYWNSVSPISYGGTWYSGSGQVITASFNYSTTDLDVDVTPIVEQWLANTIPNEGFILKFTDALEQDASSYGELKFFSVDTNTIFKPRLDVRYDDSTFVTGSSSTGIYTGSLGTDPIVYVRSLQDTYYQNSIHKIIVASRDRFPAKTFSTISSQYTDIQIMPTSSYYAVKDAYTGDICVPFDNVYTKLSFDGTNNYFNFNVGTLPSGRIYKFVFKVVRGSLVQFFDGDFLFKIGR